MPLLKRQYELSVGLPPTTTYVSDIFTDQEVFGIQDIPVDRDYRTVKLNALQITDLHIKARISSKEGSNNRSSTVIEIYNLSQESLDVIEKVNNYVILKAGYVGNELDIIFTGQVSGFETRRVGQDLITSLTCSDGYIPNNSIRIQKAFPEGTKASDVMSYIVNKYKEIGIPTGQFVTGVDKDERTNYIQLRSPDETSFEMGYSLNGYLVDELTDLCKSVGYVNYITNGRLFVHPKSYTKTVEEFEISEEQVMSIRKQGSNVNNATGKKDIGITVTALLDGRFDTGKRINILNGNYQGKYRIQSTTHILSYKSGNWNTVLDCKQIDT